MARLFDDAATQYLSTASTPVTAEPATLACWFNSDSIALSQVLLTLIEDTSNYFFLQAHGSETGDPIRAQAQSTGSGSALTSTGYTADTWHHAAGVFATTTDRRAFLDGGGKGTDAASVTGLVATAINIGGLTTVVPTSGLIAEAGVWDIALTDDEVAILAEGYSPLLVHPQNLVFYAPLVRELVDKMGGLTITNNNGATVGDHTRVLYPATPSRGGVPAAAVAALASQRLKIGVGR